MKRRHFLTGLASALAMSGAAGYGKARPAAVRPQRYLFIYTPNGYQQSSFLPKLGANAQRGALAAEWELSPTLAPLAGAQQHVRLITGLDRQFVGGTGVHAQCGSCWMSSSAPQETLDGGFPTNITLDQMLASHLGGECLLPSLELSCNDFTDSKESRYYECISWHAPGYAASVEKDPRRVFQRLFGSPDVAGAGSVLDVMKAEAKALQARVGKADQEKLQEYLDSVRATEKRLALAAKLAATRSLPALAEPAGIPERRGDYLNLQAELCLLAFQNDLTRVASIVVDPERWDSPRHYHELFDAPQNHHVLTHTKGEAATAAVAKIDRFHIQFYADIVAKLAKTPDGEGSLLDSTTVVMGSGISDGDLHHYSDLQVLLAGGGIRPGCQHFTGKRPLADLWLSLATKAGLNLPRFADSAGSIAL
jgi:hypothetical protein